MKKYNILFASHPDYSGNAKALYEYMFKYYKNADLSWVVYDKNNYVLMNNNNITCYLFGSDEFKKIYKKVNVVFFTHDELLEMKEKNQIFIYLGHGYSGKKFGYFLKDNQLAPQDKKYLSLMKKNIDYFICSSELWKNIYHAGYEIEKERILCLGSSKTDFIYTSDGKRNLFKCGVDCYKYKKIIMYLPTFRTGLGRNNDGNYTNNIFNIEEYDEKILEDFLVRNNYLLLIKYHPYELNKKEKFDIKNVAVLKEEKLINNLLSLAELLNGVDLIIGDYSSAFSDYVILNKPVCFLNNDIESYKKSRGILFDNIDFWSPGPSIKKIEEFICEVPKLLEDKKYYEKERIQYSNMMFGDNRKDCSKKIVNYLFNNNDFNLFKNPNRKEQTELEKLYIENYNLKSNVERLDLLDKELRDYKDQIYKKNIIIKSLQKELEDIRQSKEYKLLERFRKFKIKIFK